MSYGWEGNRRSAVALGIRHRFQSFIHLRTHGLRTGDDSEEHVIQRNMSLELKYGSCYISYETILPTLTFLLCKQACERVLRTASKSELISVHRQRIPHRLQNVIE